MPLSIRVFDWIYQSPARRKRLAFYGREVFHSGYNSQRIASGNLDYWMSPEALYWHLWRQTEWDRAELSQIMESDDLKGVFDAASNTAVELGFGIGKNYFAIRERIKLGKYIGVEPNPACVRYAAAKASKLHDRRLQLVNASAVDFLESSGCQDFDLLLVFGGVLMYLSPEELDRVFAAIKVKKVSKVVILNEGVPGSRKDWHRPDSTVMYNFEQRLRGVGYSNKQFTSLLKESGICRIFVMN
jgi:hypothetical protein